MLNKIYTNHSLKEYSKKYGNKNLKKVNKVDADKDPKLLQGKSWWLINDAYYEIPTGNAFVNWWHNLGRTGQIVLCSLLGVAVVTAVVVPVVVSSNKNKTVEHQAVIDSSVKDVKCSQKKLDNGALEVTLSFDTDKKQLDSIEVYIGNEKLILGTHYTLDGNKIVINKDTLDKNKTVEITIKPILKDKEEPVKPIYVTGITCDETKKMTVGDVISFDDLHVTITPDTATDKTFRVEEGGQVNDVMFDIDNDARTIKAKTAGEGNVWVIPNGSNPESEEMVFAICGITVEAAKTVNVSFDLPTSIKGYTDFTSPTGVLTKDNLSITLNYSPTLAEVDEYTTQFILMNGDTEIKTVNGTFVTGGTPITLSLTKAEFDSLENGATVTVTTAKQRFVRLYNKYKADFQKDTKVYSANEITTILDVGTSTSETISEIQYTGEGVNKYVNTSTATIKPARIDVNRFPKPEDLILDKSDTATNYEFGVNAIGVNFIKYTSSDSSSNTKELVVNEYGIIESYVDNKDKGFRLTITGKPLIPIKLTQEQININIAEEQPKVPTIGITITGKVIEDVKEIKLDLDVENIIIVNGPTKPEEGEETAWFTIELCDPMKTGEVNITVSCDGCKSAICKVTVENKAVELDKDTLDLEVNSSGTITASLSDKSTGKFTYKVTKGSKYVEVTQNVNEFTIKGLTEGVAIIEISCDGYVSATCDIVIKKAKEKDFILKNTWKAMEVGDENTFIIQTDGGEDLPATLSVKAYDEDETESEYVNISLKKPSCTITAVDGGGNNVYIEVSATGYKSTGFSIYIDPGK